MQFLFTKFDEPNVEGQIIKKIFIYFILFILVKTDLNVVILFFIVKVLLLFKTNRNTLNSFALNIELAPVERYFKF